MNEGRKVSKRQTRKRRRSALERLINLSAARALYGTEQSAETFDRYASRLKRRVAEGHV